MADPIHQILTTLQAAADAAMLEITDYSGSWLPWNWRRAWKAEATHEALMWALKVVGEAGKTGERYDAR